MPQPQVSVLVVDDDAIVREWLRQLLEQSDFRVAGVASSVGEGLELADRRRPDLMLIDYKLPDGRGTELIRALGERRSHPRTLVMSANCEPGLNELARAAGAHGSTLKTGRREELVGALSTVAAGDVAFDPRHPPRSHDRAHLSRRERDVIRLVAQGLTNHEIADSLGVGPETVKTLAARSFAKLGAKRRAEAVATAQREGLL